MQVPISGRFLSIDGQRTHYLVAGRGKRTVILLHGFASIAQEIASAFPADSDFTFIAADRPGYGYSDPIRQGRKGPAGHARHLAQFLDQLEQRNCIVVAHSLGASSALWLSRRRPDLVSDLLLIAPYCRPTRHWGFPILRAFANPALGPFVRNRIMPSLMHAIGPHFLKSALFPNPVPKHLEEFPFEHAGNPIALKAMADELLALAEDMDELEAASGRTRVRVVYGSQDRVAVPGWHLEWLERRRYCDDPVFLNGTGHAPHHFMPDRISGVLRQIA
jgi:pimeloyl-ACP methyl ester carboxylesterase